MAPSDSSRRSIWTTAFPVLFLIAWACCGALVKLDARWLYLLLAASVIAGLWAGRRQSIILRLLLLMALVFPAWKKAVLWRARSAARADASVISALVKAEETYLTLSPKMSALSKGLLDLRLPGPGVEAVFGPTVKVSDVGPAPASGAPILKSRNWPVTGAVIDVPGPKVDLWRPLLGEVSWFEHAKVYTIDGEHPPGDVHRYDANAGFDALAMMDSGEWRSLHGKMKVSWERKNISADGTEPDWQITLWETKELHWIASPKRLFAEALDTALCLPGDLAKARRSEHYEATIKYYREGMKSPPHPYFAPISANHKESVTVADIDADGFDDIYITVRIGKNLLLRNRGDGTFTEEAARFGLDLPGHTTCALFADFDNDGDLDAMLGRSLLKTTYLENQGGWFNQEPIPGYFPMAVISMSAADYNRDGLLNVYLCTYRPAAPPGASPAGGVAQIPDDGFDWTDKFFPPELAKEYRRRLAEHKKRASVYDEQFPVLLDQIGPPNVLLVNRGGGHFEPAPENKVVGLWRNSLQATWSDYDLDGDADLYVANDWAPDNLLRNDGPAGFTDVTAEAGITSYGFAMGASWGDYDNDGREDVYVSNMYSKAGRRITAKVPNLKKTFVESAAGNWLYRQAEGGKFKQVAGLAPPAMTVMKAGWSWGGRFTDFDNDGFLDLYVLAGYFTAPKELASELDLGSNLWRTVVRADENLARSSFRFSLEWKRTRGMEQLAPQIDARLAGVEQRGDKLVVHSLSGNERNHYFSNRGGRSFEDLSALSGMDNPADSRGFAVLDYDRDGWQDVALVNANQPLFNLYHNEMPAAGLSGGVIAIRFVGGNRRPAPSTEFSGHDGYGARITVDLGDLKVLREHRCGDGFAAQHTATMLLGIGARSAAASVAIRWPSGLTTSTKDIPEGTLLTAYENSSAAPDGEAFVRSTYRVSPSTRPAPSTERATFPLTQVDTNAKPDARLRVYTTFATWCPSCKKHLPKLRRLSDEFVDEGVELIAVPIDAEDDDQKLAAYAKEWRLPSRVAALDAGQRAEATAAFKEALREEPPLPCTVVTDTAGRILAAQPGVPTVSALRKFLAPIREKELISAASSASLP